MIIIKIITITSPATDAGKTFIASGLAEAGTARGLKTLFIDFDSPVGDAIRVFGAATTKAYPSVTSWVTFNNPWEQCLRSLRGTYVLPKPERPQEIITVDNIRRLLETTANFLDLVVCDLGTDFRTDYWAALVKESDLALLVSDCDEKALVRIQEFLDKMVAAPENKWTLLVNNREGRGYYTPRQITRCLGESEGIGEIIEIPYFNNIQKGCPKTFSPDTAFARMILDRVSVGVWGEVPQIKGSKPTKNNSGLVHFASKTNGSKQGKTVVRGIDKVQKNRLIVLSHIDADSLKKYRKGYIVDAAGDLSRLIETAQSSLWKADWRLGLNAQPIIINGAAVYSQTELLGPIDELDQSRLIEFIESLAKKNVVYVIDSGRWREELLRMGAAEGG